MLVLHLIVTDFTSLIMVLIRSVDAISSFVLVGPCFDDAILSIIVFGFLLQNLARLLHSSEVQQGSGDGALIVVLFLYVATGTAL